MIQLMFKKMFLTSPEWYLKTLLLVVFHEVITRGLIVHFDYIRRSSALVKLTHGVNCTLSLLWQQYEIKDRLQIRPNTYRLRLYGTIYFVDECIHIRGKVECLGVMETCCEI